MTSIGSSSSGPEPGSALMRLGRRVGHRGDRALTWVLASTIATAFAFRLADLKSLAIPFCGAVVLLLAAVFVVEHAHDRRLCEACIADMPLSPGDAAHKIRRRLQLVHWTKDHKTTWNTIELLIVVSGVGMDSMPAAGPVALAVMLTFLLAGVGVFWWFLLAVRAHKRLGPWCPYCRRDDGGGGLVIPDPEPADSTSRRR